MSNFTDDTNAQRFELEESGLIAFADYHWSKGILVIPHVEADPALRGRGAAGRLMEHILTHARRQNVKVRPLCSYAVAYIRRHPEHQDLLESA